MMNNIKLIMCDIDGTLIDDNFKIPKDNIKAIKKLKDYGIKFGIASGRPVETIFNTIKTWDILNEVEYIVGSNGAQVYYYDTNQLILDNSLDINTIKYIEKLNNHLDCTIAIYDNITLLINKITNMLYHQANKINILYKIIDFNKDIIKDYPKVLLISDIDLQKEIYQYNVKHKLETYTIIPSSNRLLEFININCSKANGIKKIAKRLNIKDDQILCFGDQLNDLEMLETFIGVAMDNAIKQVKSIANYQTINNNQAGVGYFINKYIIK